MSRANQQSELGFGSDSFLDIVANIVGILIILIVIAGVRVSNTPVAIQKSVVKDEIETVKEEAAEIPKIEPPITKPPEVPAVAIEEEPVPVVPPPKTEPSPALLERERELALALTSYDKKLKVVKSQLQTAESEDLKHAQRLKALKLKLTGETDAFAKSQSSIDGLSGALEKSKSELLALQRELKELKNQKAPVERIQHKLTAISSTVTGKEIHFRLIQNQVSVVPIKQLTERLKAQIQRQKDWLLRFRRHQGHVGPVDGYSMTYVVERQALSVLDELREGRGVVRIGVSQWQIQTDNNVIDETLEEAVRHGSSFSQTLLLADPEATTLTFWVYPDSFKLYRQLQIVAQNEDFTVAGRPMPFGVPIAGSPQGTRSAGQ